MKPAGPLFFVALACFGQDNSVNLRDRQLRKRLEALSQLPNARKLGICSIPLLEAHRPPYDYKLKVIPQTQQEKTAAVPAPPCNEPEAAR